MCTLWPHLYKPLVQNTDTPSILHQGQVIPIRHEKTSLPVSGAGSYSAWNLSSISWRSRERSTYQSFLWANLRACWPPWALRGEWIKGPSSLNSNPSWSPSSWLVSDKLLNAPNLRGCQQFQTQLCRQLLQRTSTTVTCDHPVTSSRDCNRISVVGSHIWLPLTPIRKQRLTKKE